jgi:hypothetical protein
MPTSCIYPDDGASKLPRSADARLSPRKPTLSSHIPCKSRSCDVRALSVTSRLESETLLPLRVRLPAEPTEVWPCMEQDTATLSEGLGGPYLVPEFVGNLTRWGGGGGVIRQISRGENFWT